MRNWTIALVAAAFLNGCAAVPDETPSGKDLGSTVENAGKLRASQVAVLQEYSTGHTQSETLGKCVDMVNGLHKIQDLDTPATGSVIQYCGDVLSVYVYE